MSIEKVESGTSTVRSTFGLTGGYGDIGLFSWFIIGLEDDSAGIRSLFEGNFSMKTAAATSNVYGSGWLPLGQNGAIQGSGTVYMPSYYGSFKWGSHSYNGTIKTGLHRVEVGIYNWTGITSLFADWDETKNPGLITNIDNTPWRVGRPSALYSISGNAGYGTGSVRVSLPTNDGSTFVEITATNPADLLASRGRYVFAYSVRDSATVPLYQGTILKWFNALPGGGLHVYSKIRYQRSVASQLRVLNGSDPEDQSLTADPDQWTIYPAGPLKMFDTGESNVIAANTIGARGFTRFKINVGTTGHRHGFPHLSLFINEDASALGVVGVNNELPVVTPVSIQGQYNVRFFMFHNGEEVSCYSKANSDTDADFDASWTSFLGMFDPNAVGPTDVSDIKQFGSYGTGNPTGVNDGDVFIEFTIPFEIGGNVMFGKKLYVAVVSYTTRTAYNGADDNYVDVWGAGDSVDVDDPTRGGKQIRLGGYERSHSDIIAVVGDNVQVAGVAMAVSAPVCDTFLPRPNARSNASESILVNCSVADDPELGELATTLMSDKNSEGTLTDSGVRTFYESVNDWNNSTTVLRSIALARARIFFLKANTTGDHPLSYKFQNLFDTDETAASWGDDESLNSMIATVKFNYADGMYWGIGPGSDSIEGTNFAQAMPTDFITTGGDDGNYIINDNVQWREFQEYGCNMDKNESKITTDIVYDIRKTTSPAWSVDPDQYLGSTDPYQNNNRLHKGISLSNRGSLDVITQSDGAFTAGDTFTRIVMNHKILSITDIEGLSPTTDDRDRDSSSDTSVEATALEKNRAKYYMFILLENGFYAYFFLEIISVGKITSVALSHNALLSAPDMHAFNLSIYYEYGFALDKFDYVIERRVGNNPFQPFRGNYGVPLRCVLYALQQLPQRSSLASTSYYEYRLQIRESTINVSGQYASGSVMIASAPISSMNTDVLADPNGLFLPSSSYFNRRWGMTLPEDAPNYALTPMTWFINDAGNLIGQAFPITEDNGGRVTSDSGTVSTGHAGLTTGGWLATPKKGSALGILYGRPIIVDVLCSPDGGSDRTTTRDGTFYWTGPVEVEYDGTNGDDRAATAGSTTVRHNGVLRAFSEAITIPSITTSVEITNANNRAGNTR